MPHTLRAALRSIRLLQHRLAPQLSPLEKLPVEVILLIAEALSCKADIACLALANQRMYRILREMYHPLRKDDIRRFMIRNQRLVPQGYLCQDCWKFHKFAKSTKPTLRHLYVMKGPRQLCLSRCPVDYFGSYCLRFAHVQLAMNRHFFGPKYGIPLSALSATHKDVREPWWSKEPGLKATAVMRHTWTPRIIEDELYMLTEYTFTLEKAQGEASAHDLQQVLNANFWFLCRHYKTSNTRFLRLNETAGPSWDADGSATNVRSCDICDMDYVLSVRWPSCNRKASQPSIGIIAWRRFGTCRSVHDDDWSRTSEGREKLWRDGISPRRLPSGEIRRRWEQSLAESTQTILSNGPNGQVLGD